MAAHEPSIGETSEWYAPPEIFTAEHSVPANKIYTERDDGLSKPSLGLVFMNPPFGGRFGDVPWLARITTHAQTYR